jgi:hypothetical protein
MHVAKHRTGLTGLIIIVAIALTFMSGAINMQAQTATTITPNDTFNIPQSQGSIRFALNGSCTSASLQDNAWVFTNLKLGNTSFNGTLKFSTEDSNVTINYFGMRTGQFTSSVIVRYNVDAQGKQYVNLGLNTTRKTDPSEWFVNVPNGIAVVYGIDWNLLPDNTVELNGLKGNVTVSHYNYIQPVATGPFYVQHSVAIITGAVAAAVVAVAVAIKFRGKH